MTYIIGDFTSPAGIWENFRFKVFTYAAESCRTENDKLLYFYSRHTEADMQFWQLYLHLSLLPHNPAGLVGLISTQDKEYRVVSVIFSVI